MKKQLFFIVSLITCAAFGRTFGPGELAFFLSIHQDNPHPLIQKYAQKLMGPKKSRRDYFLEAVQEGLIREKELIKPLHHEEFYNTARNLTTKQIEDIVHEIKTAQKPAEKEYFEQGIQSLELLEKSGEPAKKER